VPEQMIGTVESVIGPVVDVAFPEGNLPEIYDAITITMDDGALLTLEVEQQVGNNVVRTVAMGSTDGVRRGMEAVSDRPPIRCRSARPRWGVSSTSRATPSTTRGRSGGGNQVPDPSHGAFLCRAEHAG
jgi:hypothetical protein